MHTRPHTPFRFLQSLIVSLLLACTLPLESLPTGWMRELGKTAIRASRLLGPQTARTVVRAFHQPAAAPALRPELSRRTPWWMPAPLARLEPTPAPFFRRPRTTKAPPKMMEIVHPCNDWAFKRAFENGVYCCDFLNAVLERKGDDRFEDMMYLPTSVPSSSPWGSGYQTDLLARDLAGHFFLMEMQREMHPIYLDRVRTVHSRFEGHLDALSIPVDPRTEDSKTPLEYLNLNKSLTKEFLQAGLSGIHTIVITNQNTTPPQPEVVNVYEWRHQNFPDRVLGTIPSRITLITLANFNKKAEELETHVDRWLFFFKDDALKRKKKKGPLTKKVPRIPQVIGKADSPLAGAYDYLQTRNLKKFEIDTLAFQYKQELLKEQAIQKEIEAEREKADAEREKAEAEREKAEAEREKAEAEREKADAAEAKAEEAEAKAEEAEAKAEEAEAKAEEAEAKADAAEEKIATAKKEASDHLVFLAQKAMKEQKMTAKEAAALFGVSPKDLE